MRGWLRKAFTTDMPYWSAISSLTLIAIVPSILIAGLAIGVLVLVGFETSELAELSPDIPISSFSDAVPTLVIATPLLETAILGMGLSMLALLRLSPVATSAISALGWALAHAFFSSPLQFFGVIWSFYVFSRGYVTWRAKSLPHAYAVACIPHMAQNFLVVYVTILAGTHDAQLQ